MAMFSKKDFENLPESYRKQILEQIENEDQAKEKNNHSIPGKGLHLESDTSSKSTKKNADKKDNARSCKQEHRAILGKSKLTVRHYRRKLTDYDGLSIKAILDAAINANILSDDGAKFLSDPHHEQIQVPSGADEMTVFIFEEED